jgi:hypothetical protein
LTFKVFKLGKSIVGLIEVVFLLIIMENLLKKMNYKGQQPVVVLNAPEGFVAQLSTLLPDVQTSTNDLGTIGLGLAFCIKLEEVHAAAQQFAERMPADELMWLAYPKGSSKRYKCDFNRDTGWDYLGTLGFEPVRQVAIDEDWSALRFRRVGFIKTMTRSFAMTEEGKKKAAKD